MLEKVSRSPSQGAAWEENNVPSHILGRKQCAKPISSGKKTMCQATFSTGLPGGGQHQIAQFSACTILKMESSSTSVARTDILWSKMSFFHQILRNLQKAMATHSSTVAWRIPWTEELVGCSQRSWEESDMTERLHFHFSLSCTGKEMETYSSIRAWRIPGTEEPGGLPSVGSHRVGYNWRDLIAAAAVRNLISHFISFQFSSVAQSYLSLWSHGLQHTRPPCPSPTPGAGSNSCPSSQWCHSTISASVIPFSTHLQSFPASGSFQMNQFFASGGQNIVVSALASFQWTPRTDLL